MKRMGLVLLLLAAAALPASASDADVVRIGIVADIHVHDTDSPCELGGAKVMVNYAERIEAFVEAMNAWPAEVVIDLGDFVNGVFVMCEDLGDPERVPGLLDTGLAVLSAFEGPIYHVIGNHDVYDLTKEEYLAGIGAESTFYSFDIGAYHVVVLDAQYTKEGEDYGNVSWMVQGTVPPSELAWLREDLQATSKPTLVCIHQPLDVEYSFTAGGPPVWNHVEVCQVLAESGKVIAVFQGHTHENGYSLIDGIHYVTFAAMVDHAEPTPPSWAQVVLDALNRTITIEGFGLQSSYELLY